MEPGASADGRQVRGFGALVPAEEYVRGGVRFYALLDEALRRCAALKAEYLAERLRGTLGTLGDIGTVRLHRG